MPTVREPILKPVVIARLRPTQITVGMREVEVRRKRWGRLKGTKMDKFFEKHLIPVVLGPKNRHYIIDHHHLARAMQLSKVENVYVTIVADLSKLAQEAFWVVLDNRGWMHPFDAKGRRRRYEDIPKSLDKLVDDPFRSLAGALRRAGGFAKETSPFSEFLWADFLRRRMQRTLVEGNFARALERATRLAAHKEAAYLPGWCGPSTDD